MKSKLIFLVRLIVLVVIYFICFSAVSAALFRLPADQPTPGEANPALALFVVSFLNTVLLTYVIVRSRWAGWKLIGAVFVIFFGISTLMPQIETAYFLARLPPGMLPRIFLSGAITAAIFSALAVLVLGKRKQNGMDHEGIPLLNMPLHEWAWKLSLIAISYVALYFSFGYFIAWKSAAVRAYYGGSDPGSFLTQMGTVLRDTPGLVPLQIARALIWSALAVLVIRMMKGGWWEIGLVVALLFGVLMNDQLLIPNPFMPAEVRMVHLLETASSNFLFGWLLVWILCSGYSKRHLGDGNDARRQSADQKRSVPV